MASETSIGRNTGSPRISAVAAMASSVILASSGPTVMKASTVLSRTISLVWPASNFAIVTLSGLTPDSLRMTRSNLLFTSVLPTTATRWPARSSIALIFALASFPEPLRLAPEGAQSTTTFLRRIATDSVPSGISSSVRATARSALPATSAAMLSTGPAVVTSDSRTELPSRANVCASARTRFWSSLPDGPTAIRNVVGRRMRKQAPTTAAKIRSAVASIRNGEPGFRRPRTGKSFKPSRMSDADMLLANLRAIDIALARVLQLQALGQPISGLVRVPERRNCALGPTSAGHGRHRRTCCRLDPVEK